MRTFRARPNRSAWVMLAVLSGVWVALAVSRPGQVLWFVAGFALLGMMLWAAILVTRLEITDSVVRARQGRAKKQVARSEVCSIHYFPGVISFRGADRKPVLTTRPNWSIRQLIEVADELSVPLYEHRDPRWLWLREARTGRVVNGPATGQPVS